MSTAIRLMLYPVLFLVWLLIGIPAWIRVLVVVTATYAFGVVSAAFTGHQPPDEESLQAAWRFWLRGLHTINRALLRPAAAIGNSGAVQLDLTRVVIETVWAAALWWLTLAALGLASFPGFRLGGTSQVQDRSRESVALLQSNSRVDTIVLAPRTATGYIYPPPNSAVFFERLDTDSVAYAVRYVTSRGETGTIEMPRGTTAFRNLPEFRGIEFLSREDVPVKIQLRTSRLP